MMRVIYLLALSLSVLCARADTFIRYEENGKVGVKDAAGTIVIPATFQALGWSDGSFSVIGNVTGYRVDQRWGIINLKKEFVTAAIFESMIYAGGEHLIVQKKINPAHFKTGCINLQGQEKIPFEYDGIQIAGLRAVVFNLIRGNYQFGLKDLNNKEIIPVAFKNIIPLGSLRYAVQNTENKIALFSEAGRPVSDFMIDSISHFTKSYALIYQNLLQGLIDRDGNIVLEPSYAGIDILEIGKVRVRLPDEWVVINLKNEILKRLAAEELIAEGGDFKVVQAGHVGLVDENLKPKIATVYDQLLRLPDHRWMAKKNGRYGVLDAQGNTLIAHRFDSMIVAGGQYAALQREGWSLLDEKGKVVTYKHYTSIGNLTPSKLLPVCYRQFWGMIDEQGDEIVHCVFDSVSHVLNDRLVVKFKNQFGVINVREDWIVAPQNFRITLLPNDLYLLHTPDNMFLKRMNGEILYFTSNPYRLEKDFWIEILPDGTEKTIDYDGRIVKRVAVEGNIQKVFQSSEGFTGIQRDGKFGFVDERGRLRIANRYDSIQDFQEGLAAVKLIGRWGFVNGDDKIVINPNYDSVSGFRKGLAIAKRNGKVGVINKAAKTILGFQYDRIELLTTGNFALFNKGLKGLADHQGSILIEPRFQSLTEIESKYVLVGREGKFGVNSREGLSVIPLEYTKLTFDENKKVFLGLRKSEWKELSLN